MATSELFALLVKNDTSGDLQQMIKRNGNRYLPPNVALEMLEKLPTISGIYYFKNRVGKVIYVGKAKNIKKRVSSHFSNNKQTKQKQDFLREIHEITHTACESELVAAMLESIEIKRLWPAYNKSQKHYEHQYGIFIFEDALGYMRLGVDKKRKLLQPLLSFSLVAHANNTLWQWVREHNLHPALCFLDKSNKAMENLPPVEVHNALVKEIIAITKEEQKTYVIKETGSNYILVEEGRFYGMGKINDQDFIAQPQQLKTLLSPYPENEVIRSMIKTYTTRYPTRVVMLD